MPQPNFHAYQDHQALQRPKQSEKASMRNRFHTIAQTDEDAASHEYGPYKVRQRRTEAKSENSRYEAAEHATIDQANSHLLPFKSSNKNTGDKQLRAYTIPKQDLSRQMSRILSSHKNQSRQPNRDLHKSASEHIPQDNEQYHMSTNPASP